MCNPTRVCQEAIDTNRSRNQYCSPHTTYDLIRTHVIGESFRYLNSNFSSQPFYHTTLEIFFLVASQSLIDLRMLQIMYPRVTGYLDGADNA